MSFQNKADSTFDNYQKKHFAKVSTKKPIKENKLLNYVAGSKSRGQPLGPGNLAAGVDLKIVIGNNEGAGRLGGIGPYVPHGRIL